MLTLSFETRAEFRTWLAQNAHSDEGIWIIFRKKKPLGLKAAEALEEALCFGWIDGQMQSIDEESYRKYFKQRSADSAWSEKNKKLAVQLEDAGLMTDCGRSKIAAAKKNGYWDRPAGPVLSEEQQAAFDEMIRPHGAAYANYISMSPSVRRTYASSYFFGAKTEAGKAKRLAAVIERLELNLNPMESMKGKK